MVPYSEIWFTSSSHFACHVLWFISSHHVCSRTQHCTAAIGSKGAFLLTSQSSIVLRRSWKPTLSSSSVKSFIVRTAFALAESQFVITAMISRLTQKIPSRGYFIADLSKAVRPSSAIWHVIFWQICILNLDMMLKGPCLDIWVELQ